MPAGDYSEATRAGKLTTPLGDGVLVMTRLYAVEHLSRSYEIVVEALTDGEPVNLHAQLGEDCSVEIEGAADIARKFHGKLWEYTELGHDGSGYRYQLVLRPWTHFLSLNRDSRVFQAKTRVAIAKEVLTGGTITEQLTAAYITSDYCVQYQESDFAFASRLLEVEGVYYHYDHSGGAPALVLVDDRAGQTPIIAEAIKVRVRDQARDAEACVWAVTERRGLGPIRAATSDYDMLAPATNMVATQTAEHSAGQGTKRFGSMAPGALAGRAEVYDYPAGYVAANKAAEGERLGKRVMHAGRREMARTFATGDAFAAAVGRTLELAFDDGQGPTVEYLIVGTTHHYSAGSFRSDGGDGDQELWVELELIPAETQYRPPLSTPRPRLMGPQTAVVVGPSGEEIHTDAHGRIKVQFHWDRLGAKNDTSSMWVRVAQWIAGQSWGSFMLPRIGMEVIVDFMEGDPDQPLVTGSVYHAVNKPPPALPANKTMMGLKTRSSMGGSGWSGWTIDDKAGSELYHIRAEKNLVTHVVKGNETRRVMEGYRNTKIKLDDNLLVEDGDLITEVAKGDETRKVTLGKRTTTIKGDETLTIESGNRLDTIETGNDTLEVKMGNREATIDMGNDTLTVKMGNVVTSVKMGSHKTDAMQAIELKCGGSTIKMSPFEIEIKALSIKLDAEIMLDSKAMMIMSDGSAMQIVKGGLVMIN